MNDAFLAGFFDADGAVGIGRVRGTPNLWCRVNQTSKPILLAFKEAFGGKVHGPYSRSSNAKAHWFWSCEAATAEAFLRRIQPFVVVKRQRVDTALDFRELFKNSNVLPRGLARNPEKKERILAAREDFFLRMRALNQRGLTPSR